MNQPYLEVTYRKGQPLAAYYYLPRSSSQKSCSTKRLVEGLIVDFDAHENAIGLEITDLKNFSTDTFNKALKELGLEFVDITELEPLRRAA